MTDDMGDDWYLDEETGKRMNENFQKFAQENPNHPRTIAGLKYRAEHPEKPSNVLPFVRRSRKKEGL